MDERRQEVDDALTQMASRTDDLERIAQEQQQHLSKKNRLQAMLQKVDQELAELQTFLRQLTENLETATNTALKVRSAC